MVEDEYIKNNITYEDKKRCMEELKDPDIRICNFNEINKKIRIKYYNMRNYEKNKDKIKAKSREVYKENKIEILRKMKKKYEEKKRKEEQLKIINTEHLNEEEIREYYF